MQPRKVVFAAAAALVVGCSMLPGSARAAGSHAHEHAAERGTVENPLDIARDPTELAPRGDRTGPRKLAVELETVEVNGRLDDGTAYHYWTFNERVPGPFLRVRQGDTVEVTLRNAADSALKHSVDFHAATGPGGGAVATQAAPGETKSFTFKALNPGLYVYHCATPPIEEHIATGMYGLILVEPEGGLPPVDREFYVMQGEIYTEQPFGAKGEVTTSREKLLQERPEYFVFNGKVGAISGHQALKAKVGETVRIYFGVGGPNHTSAFHIVGEIFDRAYDLASLTTAPLTDVQTIAVPPGGAAVVDIRLQLPGDYLLVDHALSRAARGLIGTLHVEGEDDPAVFAAPAKPLSRN